MRDPDRLGLVLAAVAAALEQLAGRFVMSGLSDRDVVDRGVELTVAGAAEAMPCMAARPDRQRCGAVVPGEGMTGQEAADIGGLAEVSAIK